MSSADPSRARGPAVARHPGELPEHLRPSAVTIGNFDGVHRGHRAVLTRLAAEAHARGLSAIALTFTPHPRTLYHPDEHIALIAAPEDRDRLLLLAGADAVVDQEFTLDYGNLSAEEFVRTQLVEGLGARLVVLGPDSRFGRGNEGDVGTMRALGERLGFEVVVVDEVGDTGRVAAGTQEQERWSSSAVRHALHAGDVVAAAAMLGRAHTVSGTVVHGHERGRGLGFPTANLDQEPDGLVPADGVYAGTLTVLGDTAGALRAGAPCLISIGTNPTFTADAPVRTVEAYVLDRDDLDLYGERVRLELARRIRSTLTFDSVEQLVARMHEDVAVSRLTMASAEEGASEPRW